jgi:hypothetical protein
MFESRATLPGLCWFGCALLLASHAAAQGAAEAPSANAPHVVDDTGGPRSSIPTVDSARAGMFLPLTEAPRTDAARAFATVLGGYDGGPDSALLEGRAELTVYGPIAIRIGTLYTQHPERLRPSAGARVQALNQQGQGIDMSIGAFYKPEGFTEGEGELEAVLAFGRTFDRIGLIGDLVYGQDPEGRERDGELRLAGLYMPSMRVQLGLDSRVRVDLGTEADKLEEEGGAEYDLHAGPTFSYALDQIAFGALAGVSVLGTPKAQVGALALLTISGSL